MLFISEIISFIQLFKKILVIFSLQLFFQQQSRMDLSVDWFVQWSALFLLIVDWERNRAVAAPDWMKTKQKEYERNEIKTNSVSEIYRIKRLANIIA